MSAVILAGGKSTRMGYDKTKLMLDGKTLIDTIILRLMPVFTELLVCGLKGGTNVTQNVKYVNDIYPGVGPVGGIYTGLYYSSEDMNFITACDIPEINLKLIKYMEERMKHYDAAIIEVNGYTEPLFGLYSRRILPILKSNIEKGIYKISDAFKYMNVKFISDAEILSIEPGFKGLYNINTPEDYIGYMKGKS